MAMYRLRSSTARVSVGHSRSAVASAFAGSPPSPREGSADAARSRFVIALFCDADAPTVHILYKGGVHYDALIPDAAEVASACRARAAEQAGAGSRGSPAGSRGGASRSRGTRLAAYGSKMSAAAAASSSPPKRPAAAAKAKRPTVAKAIAKAAASAAPKAKRRKPKSWR